MNLVKYLPWLLLVLALTSSPLAETRDPGEYFFDQSFGDFSEELDNARQQGKQGILIMFEMDECPFCHRMKATILNQSEVQDYFKEHFLIFSVDVEGDVEITDFQGQTMAMKDFSFKQYRVRATPVFQFFDLQGKPIKRARFTGATNDKEEFLLLGQYVVDNEYEKSSFTRYKRSKRK